jgi:hypothetical protein
LDSRFWIVVISRAFLSKSWPEYELRGLVAKEIGFEKVILPIWHEVSRDEVLKFSPPLADKVALDSRTGIPHLAQKPVGQIRPNLLTRLHRRMAHELAMSRGRLESIDPEALQYGPPIHEKLPPDLVGRIRLVRAALLAVYPGSMANWLDGFRRDSHPAKEVMVWEHMTACFLECVAAWPMTPEEQSMCWWGIFALTNSNASGAEQMLMNLSPEKRATLIRMIQSQVPPLDTPDLERSFPNPDGQATPVEHDHEDFDDFDDSIDFRDLLVDEFIADHFRRTGTN